MIARLERWAGRALLAVMVLLTIFYLLQLSLRADKAVRRAAQAAAAGQAPADQMTIDQTGSGVVLHLDRAVAPHALSRGWSGAEPGVGTWSVGEAAEVKLSLPPGRAQVAVTLEPFLAPGVARQRIAVAAGSQALGRWSLSEAKTQTLEFTAPPGARDADGALSLAFTLPDAAAPAGHAPGSTDTRRLAIKLIRIEARVAR